MTSTKDEWNMNLENGWKGTDRGKLKYLEKNLSVQPYPHGVEWNLW